MSTIKLTPKGRALAARNDAAIRCAAFYTASDPHVVVSGNSEVVDGHLGVWVSAYVFIPQATLDKRIAEDCEDDARRSGEGPKGEP